VAVHRCSDGADPLLPEPAAAPWKGDGKEDELAVAVKRDGEGTRQIEDGWK